MSAAPSIKTKFGTASVYGDYYIITSKKEGNYRKRLHRLIIEDFYNILLPKDWVVHHDDGNKLNNEIWNLIPMPLGDHSTLHNSGEKNWMYGKTHSDEVKQIISKRFKGTSLTDEHKKKISDAISGENHPLYGKHHSEETKQKLREVNKNRIFTPEQRKKISIAKSGKNHPLYGKHHSQESRQKMSKSHKGKKLSETHIKNMNIARSNTGIYHVIVKDIPRYTQGYAFAYKYNEEGKTKTIWSRHLQELKEKVLARNFPWEILDENKAKKVAESVGLTLEDIV